MTAEEFKSRLLPVKNKLFRLAFTLLSNRQEAEDTVQEVYLKMWNMRNDLVKYKSTEALMVTITRNLCLDKLKSKKNKTISINQTFSIQESNNPEQAAEEMNMVNIVKQIMQQLPVQQKTVIHLRDIEGYDYEEIVKITGFEMNYVRVNISRGRKKIRETIQKMQSYDTSKASRLN